MGWQNGDAPDCNPGGSGSIPGPTSKLEGAEVAGVSRPFCQGAALATVTTVLPL